MKASDNPYPSILVDETTAPSAPAASKRRLYVDANHVLHWIDSGSVDSPMVAVNKWNGTTAPAVTDDSGDGYAIGSRWIDTTNDAEYVCTDATVGAAVWKETTSGGAGAAVGSSELIYRYTVVGSDKSSIDTGVDTADAGSGVWSNGDVLEVEFMGRSDSGAANISAIVTVNNDTGANYDRVYLAITNTSHQGGPNLGATSWDPQFAGAGAAANYSGTISFRIPGYCDTVFYKTGWFAAGHLDSSASVTTVELFQILWRNTAAITRMKFAPGTGSEKWKVGTKLMIWKRTTS